MKRALKILCVAALIVAIFIVIVLLLLKYISGLPTPPENYRDKLETGGEIEAKYLMNGNFATSYYEEPTLQVFEKYQIHYPTELISQNKKYPVIVVCNGTGWKASLSKHIYDYYASWGFIVVSNEETYSWNAFGAEMAIRHLERLNDTQIIDNKDNIFYQKIDFENIGIIGHSQGGVGVINAITNTEHKDIYKTAIALSPTNKELATNLEWHYDAGKINIPIMLVSGAGGGDDWVVTDEGLKDIYNDIGGSKIKLRRKDTPHGDTLYSEDGYVMAWFMWHLQGDEIASEAFVGENAEILHNALYQDIEKDF